MQTVSLFEALLLSNPFVDLGEMDVPARFLLALVALGAKLVELFVVPAVALEAADVLETALIVHTGCQCLNAQFKCHDTLIAQGTPLAFLPFLARLAWIVFMLL